MGQRIGEAAQTLFEQIDRRDPVRLVGVRAENLRPAGGGGMGLWDDDEDWRKVEGAVDEAVARFGSATISRARHIGRGDGRGAVQHPKAHGLD